MPHERQSHYLNIISLLHQKTPITLNRLIYNEPGRAVVNKKGLRRFEIANKTYLCRFPATARTKVKDKK